MPGFAIAALSKSKSTFALLLLGTVGFLSACNGSSISGSSAPILTSVSVGPANSSIAAGESQQFSATGLYSDGSKKALSSGMTWTSSNTAVATISSLGQVSTHGVGTTTIAVTASSVSGSTTLTVTSASLTSIAITPTTASLAVGAHQQFTATGVYSDNSTRSVTATATWSSSNTAVASVSNTAGSSGAATALAVGVTEISAAMGSVRAAAVSLTVTPAALTSMAITPATASISPGSPQQFMATGVYSDNSTRSVTATATWSSSNTAVASVSNTAGSNGVASALAVGSTEINAAIGSVHAAAVTLTVTNETVLHSFTGLGGDGSDPQTLIQGSDGNFYGTTANGGAGGGWGTVFKLTAAGVETVLHAFTDSGGDGIGPAALIQASDGSFYGTTGLGGANDQGTVFKLSATGVETVLYSFTGTGSDGREPWTLIQGSDGNFYGTTQSGGTSGWGTVFKLTPAGAKTVLYSFSGSDQIDGAQPLGLIQASDGNFYGTTYGRSYDTVINTPAPGKGTVFKLTPTGTLTLLHTFTGTGGDGSNPDAGVIQASDGSFYGTTSLGGTSGQGTVFKITATGVETVLYSFTGTGGDGGRPWTLMQGSDGNFYGATGGGGSIDDGTLFAITPAGVETVLYSFPGSTVDGVVPTALIQGSDGNFYGTTEQGGTSGQGTVFKYLFK